MSTVTEVNFCVKLNVLVLVTVFSFIRFSLHVN